MNALRNVHQALVPGGILLDVHPVPPSGRAEQAGVSLGEFDDAEFFELVRVAEARFEQTGLFALDSELEFDFLERYGSGEEMLADLEDWEGCRVPPKLAGRIRSARPPIDLWERAVLKRFRAL